MVLDLEKHFELLYSNLGEDWKVKDLVEKYSTEEITSIWRIIKISRELSRKMNNIYLKD